MTYRGLWSAQVGLALFFGEAMLRRVNGAQRAIKRELWAPALHKNLLGKTGNEIAGQSLAAISSGLLLFAAFPPLEWSPAAWVALVPLLMLISRASPKESFLAGLMAGLIFWGSSMAWLTRVSWPGWFLLSGYCALYVAGFSVLASWVLCPRRCHSRLGTASPSKSPVRAHEFSMEGEAVPSRFCCGLENATAVAWRPGMVRSSMETIFALFVIPALWVGFEYLRSTLFTGFPWNPLGVSQALLLPLIQWAEWGGVYAVSFLVVLVNAAVTLTLLQARALPRPHGGRWLMPLVLSLALVAGCWAQGTRVIRRVNGQPGLPLRVAVIQLNIPQFEKWAAEFGDAIEARLERITTAAIARCRPELVVWPETAVPSFVRECPSTQKLIASLLTYGVPLLVGAMDFEKRGDGIRYYNSSFLFDPDRGLTQTYVKRHLVIFGEYVPLDDVFPFLRRLTPIEESFDSGMVPTVFRLDTSPRAFSVLICFEDTVADLARDAVRAGARLLINQTNDAWFDPSCASRQHMLQGLFRCVENRVPAVRSTNTGITCFIDRTGKVSAMLAPGREPSPEPECMAQTVVLPGPEMPLTFYTKYGDLFAKTCVGVVVLVFGLAALKARASYFWRKPQIDE